MTLTTEDVARRFNRAFVDHDRTGFDELIADDCVMEAVEPSPDGERLVGRGACLAFWHGLIDDTALQFTDELIQVGEESATIRWRLAFGRGPLDHVRGVTLLTVRAGRIVEALGYGKSPGVAAAPLGGAAPGSDGSVVIAGHTSVTPAERDAYVAGLAAVVTAARGAEGCLDFAISADAVDPARVNTLERWSSRSALEEFRRVAPAAGTRTRVVAGWVVELDVTEEHLVFGGRTAPG